MAVLRSRCRHYVLPCGFFYLLYFFSSPNLSGHRVDVYHTWCGLSANLGWAMCCTQFAGNTGRKNDAKNRHFGTIAQLCWAVGLSSQLKHCVHKRKNLLSSNTSSTRPRNMVNFGPLTADIGSGVLALLQISTGFVSWQRYCTAL